jgi:hypothetical protein
MDPRLYDATAIASGFVPGSGLMDFIGQAPAIGGGMGPSFMQNIRNKQYLDALLQTAGAAGDAMMVVPPVGMTVKAATTAGKTARAGSKTADALAATNKTQSIVREGNPIQSAVVLIGDKIFTGRTHTDAFNRAIYEGVVRRDGGKFIYPKDAEINSDLFMTKDGQIIDRLQASKMFDIGASETAIKEGLMQNKPAGSMGVDSYIKQAEAIKKQREEQQANSLLQTLGR